MSEKEAPEQTNQNNTSEAPRQLGGNSKKRSHKTLWAIILCVVILVAAGWVGWWYLSSNVREDKSAQGSNSNGTRKLTTQQVMDKTDQLNLTGKESEALSYVDEQIKKTDDTAKKAALMNTKAGIYVDNNEVDKGIEAAKQSLQVNPTGNTYAYIAEIYATKKKDYHTAAKYYSKAVDWMKKHQPDSWEIQTYEQIIKKYDNK